MVVVVVLVVVVVEVLLVVVVDVVVVLVVVDVVVVVVVGVMLVPRSAAELPPPAEPADELPTWPQAFTETHVTAISTIAIFKTILRFSCIIRPYRTAHNRVRSMTKHRKSISSRAFCLVALIATSV
jgi:hypothetical protein